MIALTLFRDVFPNITLYAIFEMLMIRKLTSMLTINGDVPKVTLNLTMPFTGTCFPNNPIRFYV